MGMEVDDVDDVAYRIVSTRNGVRGEHHGCEEGDHCPAAVPLWRGREELQASVRDLMREEQDGGLKHCRMLRVETRVSGIGVDEAILWLRAQRGAACPQTPFLLAQSGVLLILLTAHA